jgi:putative PIN family toxin of toxin-antitoxin system
VPAPLITIDTNVYISALNFGGVPLDLLHAFLDGIAEVAISEPILAEIRRVLRDKFEWDDNDLAEAEALIRGFSKFVEPDEVLYVVDADPSDNRIIECAAKSGSQFIVTGDKHLLTLERYEGISIITPTTFLTPARSIGAETPEP